MNGLPFLILVLSLGAMLALTQAGRLMADARVEFQGRLRDLALRRARRMTALALAASTAVAAMVGYAGWPSGATPVAVAHAGSLKIGRDLKLSHDLTLAPDELASASSLRPHLREQEHVAN